MEHSCPIERFEDSLNFIWNSRRQLFSRHCTLARGHTITLPRFTDWLGSRTAVRAWVIGEAWSLLLRSFDSSFAPFWRPRPKPDCGPTVQGTHKQRVSWRYITRHPIQGNTSSRANRSGRGRTKPQMRREVGSRIREYVNRRNDEKKIQTYKVTSFFPWVILKLDT